MENPKPIIKYSIFSESLGYVMRNDYTKMGFKNEFKPTDKLKVCSFDIEEMRNSFPYYKKIYPDVRLIQLTTTFQTIDFDEL